MSKVYEYVTERILAVAVVLLPHRGAAPQPNRGGETDGRDDDL